MTGCKLHACNQLAECFSKCFLHQQHPHSLGTKCKFSDSLSKLLNFDFWGWGPRNRYSTLVFLPRESCRWRSLVGCSPQGHTELRRLSMLACIGEGNGNPLQCSCLENPRDRGAWWAAVYGVARSRKRLKRLSSSSSSSSSEPCG